MSVIAFIPVRGGSKSIPLKNIKPLCGKPLVCWNIEALEDCKEIDEIIIATDSDIIAETITNKSYIKTHVFRRSSENASDSSSTESVMLEYIQCSQLSADTTFILAQATSPLTETHHFSEALSMFRTGKYDSILTCVRNKRFFWNANGSPLNYDYTHRPRRQEFDGMLMENGAFYINTVGNILRDENRLSGKIGIYEMPEYTGIEIDEPDDWTIVEQLINKYKKSNSPGIKIKLFLTDIDGTLTDGGMYYSENGDELKKFNTRDGMGLQLLHEAGIKTGIITSETRNLNKRRAEKLHIDYYRYGVTKNEKLKVTKEICNDLSISLSEVAYIGDDINCYELLSAVGLAACPYDAIEKIKSIPNIIHLNKKGGEGCVRELVDIILKKQ